MGVEAKFVVLLGPPGSGKGTQAALLADRVDLPAISTGDMVRQAIASGSDLGRRVEAIVHAGDLVDDATMAEVVKSRLGEQDAAAGALLDGYPRTLRQAEDLDSILESAGRGLFAVVMIDVEESELVARMLGRGRADDNEQVIRRRLAVYRERTEPLVEHYRERGMLLEVDGNLTIQEVHAAILESLGMGSESLLEVEG